VLLRLLTHFEFSLPDDPEERKIEGWNRMLTKPFGGFLQKVQQARSDPPLTNPVQREGKYAFPRLPIKITPLKQVEATA
jgi:hypothetical protein